MAKGIDLARAAAPEHAAAIEEMLPQLLICFLRRLGSSIDIPVAEVDDTGGLLLAFNIDPLKRSFHFELQKKQ
jgi:hypothetical protein